MKRSMYKEALHNEWEMKCQKIINLVMNSSYLFTFLFLLLCIMYHNKSAKFWKCSYDYAIFANEFPEVSHLFFIFAVFPNLSSPFPIQHDNWTNNGVDSLWLWLCTRCIHSNSVLQPVIDFHIPIGRTHSALCACPFVQILLLSVWVHWHKTHEIHSLLLLLENIGEW